MRTKKFIYNSITAVLLQLITVICGLILPRMILNRFGSEINGAISSITQFLSYISLIESGVGGVTRAGLYKPLAEKDSNKISGIINATESFFRKIAVIFVIYVLVVACLFPVITNNGLDWSFSFLLVLIISISSFVQYYFGITYSILLQADQLNYISNILSIITVLFNTIISILLIKIGMGIHVVKLVSAVIFIVRPIGMNLFVKRKYGIDKTVPGDDISIKQRWNGLGQHIAFFVHNNTDIVVVSVMLGLKHVSVYSVYYMVTNGIKGIVSALIGSVESVFGNMIAKKEEETLKRNFGLVESLASMLIIVFFTTTGLLMVDFVGIYTKGISDIEYIIKSFAILITVSEALHCMKNPYNSLVWAAGHYKETQKGAFVEAGVNIVLSVVLVCCFGISGVVVATIIATCIRVFDLLRHLKHNIIFRNYGTFIKRQIINILNVMSAIIICKFVVIKPENYIQCVGKAIIIFFITSLVTFLWNFIFYRKDILEVYLKLKNVLIKSR